MKNLISTLLIMFVFLASIAYAGTGIFNLKPDAYTTKTSTLVNFSLKYNETAGGDGQDFNATVLNASSSSGPYSHLCNSLITNNSFWNISCSIKDNTRTWFKINITNATGGVVTSAVRIFDMDTNFLTFQLGAYQALNFTLNTGDIAMAGTLTVGSAITVTGLVTCDGLGSLNNTVIAGCDGSREGQLRYNSTQGMYFVCANGTNWREIQWA